MSEVTRTITVIDRSDGSFVEIEEAIVTANPHLAVHPSFGEAHEPWTCTHIRTGASLAQFRSIDEAFLYAENTIAGDADLWDFGELGNTQEGQPAGLLGIHQAAMRVVEAAREGVR